MIHTGVRLFGCGKCNKGFTHASNLLIHERIHSGEGPFGCVKCNKEFSYASSLRAHDRIHTDERPFVCGKCNKGDTNVSNLRRHEIRHIGEQRVICDFRPLTNNQTSEFPFVCDTYNHHTSHRVYVCSECDQISTRQFVKHFTLLSYCRVF